jgi:hypothetical protein
MNPVVNDIKKIIEISMLLRLLGFTQFDGMKDVLGFFICGHGLVQGFKVYSTISSNEYGIVIISICTSDTPRVLFLINHMR